MPTCSGLSHSVVTVSTLRHCCAIFIRESESLDLHLRPLAHEQSYSVQGSQPEKVRLCYRKGGQYNETFLTL